MKYMVAPFATPKSELKIQKCVGCKYLLKMPLFYRENGECSNCYFLTTEGLKAFGEEPNEKRRSDNMGTPRICCPDCKPRANGVKTKMPAVGFARDNLKIAGKSHHDWLDRNTCKKCRRVRCTIGICADKRCGKGLINWGLKPLKYIQRRNGDKYHHACYLR